MFKEYCKHIPEISRDKILLNDGDSSNEPNDCSKITMLYSTLYHPLGLNIFVAGVSLQ